MTALADLEPAVDYIASRYYVPGMDHDDLVQEGMIGALKGLRTWRADGGSTRRTFALFCAERHIQTCVKTGRYEMRRAEQVPLSFDAPPPHEPDAAVTLAGVVPDRTPDLQEQIEIKERLHAAVRMLWEDMTPAERRSLVGTAFGYSYREIAERTGMKHKTIDNACQRAQAKVRLLAA